MENHTIKMDIVKCYLLPSSTTFIPNNSKYCGGARGVMVIVVGNGHGDTSSNPGRD